MNHAWMAQHRPNNIAVMCITTILLMQLSTTTRRGFCPILRKLNIKKNIIMRNVLKVFKFLNEKLLRTGNGINNCLIAVFQHLVILSITHKKSTMISKPRFYLNIKLTISKSCNSYSLLNIILFPCTTRKGLWQFNST